ncbi:FtsX-like permease family protein [Catenuloplanes atrovinosus]|uniref:ABC3 transporter permease C-terminal domain-containing protein n=1 Tax=Catenuloplanes atrovinosus TaxID=137266 RepID=A0AAE4CBY5_9ACTN|nr:FtsX-like permease family protein [Catenuloplanes atrovinosus]MDR7276030.1 hypothetical protein [Catenuloplanes atrovinosus]
MTPPPISPRRRSAVRRWAADLALGARLSVAGGRAGWTRLGLITVGVGLGVAMLLITATIPTLVAARSARLAERAEPVSAEQTVRRGDTTVLVAVANSDFGGRSVHGRLLQAEGTRPVLPPGVTVLPAPGEMVVSPALAALMDSGDGAVLRERWDARVVGEIGPAGLAGPAELVVYLGTDRLTEETAQRADRFGRPELDEGLDPVLVLLGAVGLAALLVPVGVFVATAVRFGGETRDRRLAAVRLVGADAGMTRRIAAGETLTAALLGLLTGGLVYLLAAVTAGGLVPAGMSFYPADARPVPALAVLTVLAVPVAAVLVTLSALRRVVVEPLGVVRLHPDRHRRLWWRLVLPILGLIMLEPLYDGIGEEDAGFEIQILGGLIALLVGVALLLPWWVEATVRRLGGGSVAWELAIRRLQLDSGTAVRAVSGIAVSVAGAIALQGLLVAVQAQYAHDTGRGTGDFQASVWPSDLDTGRWLPALRDSPGVRAVSTETVVMATDTSTSENAMLQIGDCTVLRQFASIETCADGDAFVATGVQVTPGGVYDLGGTGARWTLPADVPAVAPIPGLLTATPPVLLATPGALTGVAFEPYNVEYYVALDPGDPAAIERLRNTATGIDPTAGVSLIEDRVIESVLTGIRQALLVLATALLLLIGASLVVTVAEQLTERRRPLAVLVAFGTRRATLTGSILYQVAIPVLLGMVLAILTGAGLGVILQTAAGAPVSLDWPGIALTSGAAVLVILLATIASLPLLWRLTKPTGLRTE